MTYRRRRTWAGTAIGAAVLAAVTLLALPGCAPAVPANADTGAAHLLTVPTAVDVYRSYLAASDAAAALGNETEALTLVTAAQWAQVKSQYTALDTNATPVPRYRYGAPQFYVPALAEYPEWFVVAVPRSAEGGGTPVNTLMLFTRADKNVTWSLGGSAVLDRPLPALARNRDGYAVAVPNDDGSLLMRPDVLGATHAAVVDEGPASPAAAVVGGGPLTTGLYAAQASHARAEAALGVQYQWLLEGEDYPQFELRTADGGALVLYAMYLETVAQHANLAGGRPIPIPAGAVPILALPGETGYHGVWVNSTYEFAAIDPPGTARTAKMQVIGSQGEPTYAHAI